MEYLRGFNRFGLCSSQDYNSLDQLFMHHKLIMMEFMRKHLHLQSRSQHDSVHFVEKKDASLNNLPLFEV